MSAYSLLLAIHAILAVLGVGPTVAVALRARSGGPGAVADLRRLLWLASFSLFGLLLSGVAVIRWSGAADAFVDAWWLRVSGALFLVLGALVGYARRLLAKPDPSLRKVERLGWAMCALVGAIVGLMEAKPF